jgi:PAS domain S-box-containing protein
VTTDDELHLSEKIASAAAELYHAILESTSAGIITIDRDDLIVYVNGAASEMWGYGPSELVGNPISLLLPTLSDRTSSDAGVGAIGNLVGRELDVEGHARDGTRIRTAVSVRETLIGSTPLYTAAFQDISDRLRYQEALVEARARAEDMARVRTALITNIGHEIRTPLTGIQGFSRLLIDESEGTQQEFARLIEKNSRRLLDTLNSVLELARLESPLTEKKHSRFDAVSVLKDVTRLLSPGVPTEGVQLIVECSHSKIIVDSIETSLYSILHNLISNAIKFTRSGTIQVGMYAQTDAIRIEIVDTGVGISPEFLPRLFNEFTQESTGLDRSFEGSGLGLTIARHAVDSLGGEIQVDSTKGEGTRFVVTLPAAARARGDAVVVQIP